MFDAEPAFHLQKQSLDPCPETVRWTPRLSATRRRDEDNHRADRRRSIETRTGFMEFNRFDTSAKELVWDDPADWLDRFGSGSRWPVEVIDSDITALTASADKVLKVGGPLVIITAWSGFGRKIPSHT
jgi:hypothetical protein